MNILKSLIWLLPFAGGLVACGSDDEEGSTSQETNVSIVTGDIQDVSLVSAILLGTVNASAPDYVEVGIAYSLENSNDITYAKATDWKSGTGRLSYSVTINGLQPDAAYTYSAYAKTADGKIANAKEQKTFRTESPAWLLKYNAIQWVAITDATLSWTIPNEEVLSVLKDTRLNASFGIAWSTNRDDVTPVGTKFSTNTQDIAFNKGLTATTRLVSLKPSTEYYYSTYVSINGKLYVSSANNFVTLAASAITGIAPESVQMVDLGLPSGTKWASMNIGAKKAEDAGMFFAWGETVGYESDCTDGHTFNWSNYKWCNGARETQTKYCTNSNYGTVDNKVLLDLADDAAYINWGDNWRMPTVDEVNELFDNTKNEWITQDGVSGCKFTSTSTGNSIFLPSAGCRVSESHYDEGQNGYYWSASVDQPNPYSSCYLGFKSNILFPASLHRYYGMTVRPVLRK